MARIAGSYGIQLRDDLESCFLNVDSSTGHIKVWGYAYERPTYLVRQINGNHFALLKFSDEKWAEEFFEENYVDSDKNQWSIERI